LAKLLRIFNLGQQVTEQMVQFALIVQIVLHCV